MGLCKTAWYMCGLELVKSKNNPSLHSAATPIWWRSGDFNGKLSSSNSHPVQLESSLRVFVLRERENFTKGFGLTGEVGVCWTPLTEGTEDGLLYGMCEGACSI